MPSSRGSSQPRDQTQVSHIAGKFFTVWATTEAQTKYYEGLKSFIYAEYIMRNDGLEEAQAGIKIAGRNINNLRYVDDTTLMAESEEELKSLLMKMKESKKAGLKRNIQNTKIMASGPITSWQIDGETVETVSDFILGGLQNHCRWWLQPWN